MYNNGFSGGLVAMMIIPLLDLSKQLWQKSADQAQATNDEKPQMDLKAQESEQPLVPLDQTEGKPKFSEPVKVLKPVAQKKHYRSRRVGVEKPPMSFVTCLTSSGVLAFSSLEIMGK